MKQKKLKPKQIFFFYKKKVWKKSVNRLFDFGTFPLTSKTRWTLNRKFLSFAMPFDTAIVASVITEVKDGCSIHRLLHFHRIWIKLYDLFWNMYSELSSLDVFTSVKFFECLLFEQKLYFFSLYCFRNKKFFWYFMTFWNFWSTSLWESLFEKTKNQIPKWIATLR